MGACWRTGNDERITELIAGYTGAMHKPISGNAHDEAGEETPDRRGKREDAGHLNAE